jgi:acyl-CoA synthetase (AMP-forming)/AMP-acid ligase II
VAVEVRLDDPGELLVRGPNVMRGYWADPARTATVLDTSGWYHATERGNQIADWASTSIRAWRLVVRGPVVRN